MNSSTSNCDKQVIYMDQEQINVKELKRRKFNQVDDQEFRYSYKLEEKFNPLHMNAFSFNNQYIAFIQNETLKIYCLHKREFYFQDIQNYISSGIKLIRISPDSKYVHIATIKHLIIFQLIGGIIKYRNKIKLNQILQFKYSSGLLLIDSQRKDNFWRTEAVIKLYCQKKVKLIFKINHEVFMGSHVLEYDYPNSCILYQENKQKRIKVQNILNRQVLLMIEYSFSITNLSQVFMLKNDLICIYDQFLTIQRLNYNNRTTELIKQQYKNSEIQIHVIENKLAILGQTSYVIFDKNYNVFRRFKVNFKPFHPFCNKQIIHYSEYPNFLIFQDLKSTYIFTQAISKQYYLQEINYYYISFDRDIPTQQIISPNGQYLAISYTNLLILYSLKNSQEILKQYFSPFVKALDFSVDSSYLYIQVPKKILCLNLIGQKIQILLLKGLTQLRCQRQFIITRYDIDKIYLYMRNSRKQITKFNIQLKDFLQIDFIFQDQVFFLIGNYQQLIITSIFQRNLIIKQNIRHSQYQLIPNTQIILLMTQKFQLQLFRIDYQKKQFILLRNLVGDIRTEIQIHQPLFLELLQHFLIIEAKGYVSSQIFINYQVQLSSTNNKYMIIMDHYSKKYKYSAISVVKIDEFFE